MADIISAKKLKLLISLLVILLGTLFFSPGLKPNPTPSAIPAASDSAVPLSPVPEGFVAAQVVKVVDGDTIEVAINGQNFKLRYIGVNTPETVDPRRPVQCFGYEASEVNKKLLEGKTVYLEKDISETDKFGRLLRYVYLPTDNGLLFVNDYLVREGYAEVNTFPPDVKYVERYTQAQTEARNQNKGLWGKCQ